MAASEVNIDLLNVIGKQQAVGLRLTACYFQWNSWKFRGYNLCFEPWPHHGLWPLTSFCRSSPKSEKKCICRGSSLQKVASSSFSFFVRHFLFFGLCLASASV